MSHDASVWILSTGFYATRWRAWLSERDAPELSSWAEAREGHDPRRDVPAAEYRVPSMMPPIKGDDEARREVFELIRRRLDLLMQAA